MRRSELYEKVWAKPMVRLARELGISDVGLAKACRRHSVPVPPRGYWAKLQAGQTPPKTPLPAPELDLEVDFATTDPAERDRQRTAEQHRKEAIKARTDMLVATVGVTVPEKLDRPHPLVAATQRYVERVPRLVERYKRRGLSAWRLNPEAERPPFEQHGRYSLFREGLLNITASLSIMEWALRFHDAIFKALIAGGMKIQWCPAQESNSRHRQSEPACIQLSQSGETFKVEFSQGYRRVPVDPETLAERRKSESWVRDFEYIPSEKLSFRIIGSEYAAKKSWDGTQEKLQAQVSEIVQTIFGLVPLQAELRTKREAAAELARQQAEQAALQRRRREARTEQLKNAFAMAEAHERVRNLEAFLSQLDLKLDSMNETARQRCKVWLRVVREELKRSNPVERLLSDALSTPTWGTWPPDWWPVEANDAIDESADVR